MVEDMKLKEIEAQPMLSIRQKSRADTIGKDMGELFPQIMNYIIQQGAQPAGMPFAIYHQFGPEGVDMECAIPVAQPMAGSGAIVAGETPGGRVAVVSYFGPYNRLKEAYNGLGEWMEAEGLEPAGPPWEVYVTDPGQEPDSAEWQTDVYYPV